jgi:lipoate-protein ligase A
MDATMETAQGDAMHGEYKMPGGKLVVIDLDVRDGRLAGVQLSGDFFLEPDSALHVIDAALEGLPANTTEAGFVTALHDALDPDALMYGVSPEAIAVALHRALQGADNA